MEDIAPLLNFQRQGSFNLMDVFIESPAEIGESLGVVWQQGQTQGMGCHAGRIKPLLVEYGSGARVSISSNVSNCRVKTRRQLEAAQQGIGQGISNRNRDELADECRISTSEVHDPIILSSAL